MASPFVAEISMAGFNFAPHNWSFCNGSLLAISQNTALFSLLGTNYGGNGTTNFALPNLLGRLPMHPGTGPGLTNRSLGETGGVESVTLSAGELAQHSHTAGGGSGTAADSADPVGRYPSTPANGATPYASAGGALMAAASGGTVASAGTGQAHNNLMPAQCVNFIICLFGIFPSRN